MSSSLLAVACAVCSIPDAQARASVQRRLHKERSALSTVAHRALPAVVAISTKEAPEAGATEPQTGLGSGFIISPDGYILTSQHVIDGATEIHVQLWTPDGMPREVKATVAGQDKATDTALLHIDTDEPLPVLELGRSDDVDIADWVVVIGNPFGLAHSVTVGVVSFIGRTDINPTGAPGYLDYLQTDAPINPGSSGGPILDLNGRVIAIANAVNVSGQGIGFGIPIDVAKAVLPQLKATGSVRRAWLGVSVQDLTPELSDVLHTSPHGVLVAEIVRGGPAGTSGLQVGDVITEVDGRRVFRAQALRWEVTTKPIGHSVRVKVMRDGKAFATRVRLAEQPAAELAAEKEPPTAAVLPLGAVLDDVDTQASLRAGLASPYGALVSAVKPGSVLSEAGLSRGDIVLKMNHAQVQSREELVHSLQDAPKGSLVRLFVRREDRTVVLEFRKP